MKKLIYFENVKNYEDLKNQYRKLARKLHPDIANGNEKKFIDMKNEYDYLHENLKDFNEESKKQYYSHSKVKFDFKDIIDKIITINDIRIEIMGTWIWVWDVKKEDVEKHTILKSAGFKYAKNKNAWTFGERGKFHKKGMSKDEIRSTFGSEMINNSNQPKNPNKSNKNSITYKPLLD